MEGFRSYERSTHLMTSNIMFKVEKFSGSFLSFLLSVMQATITKIVLHPSGEKTKFCTDDHLLPFVFLSVVLVSSLGGAYVADDGKYLRPKSKMSDMCRENLNQVILVK
jgi:hypothetical protein